MGKAGTNDAELRKAILERAEKERVKFLRLQFTDILGVIKNVEVPDRQFADALDGEIMFDGSSIEGFVRIEESDMYLKPDLATFQVFPWTDPSGARVGRLICDIANPDGTPFAGCPRTTLKRVIATAADRGFTMKAGPETEFFLFLRRDGRPTTETHDARQLLRPRARRPRRGRPPRDRARARADGLCRSRPRTTRSRPASTRSTSTTTTCWRRPTT